MHPKDREFIKSLPRYPLEFVGKLPDAMTCEESEFVLKDKDAKEIASFHKEIYLFQDSGSMGYWILDHLHK